MKTIWFLLIISNVAASEKSMSLQEAKKILFPIVTMTKKDLPNIKKKFESGGDEYKQSVLRAWVIVRDQDNQNVINGRIDNTVTTLRTGTYQRLEKVLGRDTLTCAH